MSFSAATTEVFDVITTKHRNAPVGTVKLLLEPQFTHLRNLAT